MKIKEIRVKEFKSLKDLSLGDLGDFNVLLGENGSGKTNLVEILDLFFSDFSFSDGSTSPALKIPNSWNERIPVAPIEVRLAFELSDEECETIFKPPEVLNAAKEKFGEGFRRLEICREVARPGASWVTRSIRWGGFEICRDDKLALPEELRGIIGTPEAPEPGEGIQEIGKEIENHLKKSLVLIPANRDVMGFRAERKSFLRKEMIVNPFCDAPTSEDPKVEQMISEIKDQVKKFVPYDLDLSPGRLRLWEHDLRIDVENLGGGLQTILSLIWQIYSTPGGSVIMIEEPENHLHPEFSMKLNSTLKEGSDKRQTFVITHSTIFIDQSAVANNWLLSKQDRKSSIKRILERGELTEIMDRFGAKLYPRKILLAPEKEKIFLQNLARNLGYDFRWVLSPLYAELDVGKIREIAGQAEAVLVLVVDKNAREIAEAAKFNNWVREEDCFVLEGTLEDLYPKDLLVRTLRELYGVKVKEEKISPPIAESVEKIKKIPKDWRVPVASEIAKRWSVNIHPDLMKILEGLA